jgi:hypothetical protein
MGDSVPALGEPVKGRPGGSGRAQMFAFCS